MTFITNNFSIIFFILTLTVIVLIQNIIFVFDKLNEKFIGQLYCDYPTRRTMVKDCNVVHGNCDQWYQSKNGSNNICVIDRKPRSSPPPPGQYWCKNDINSCYLYGQDTPSPMTSTPVPIIATPKPTKDTFIFCNYPKKRILTKDCIQVQGDCDQYYQDKNNKLSICEIDNNDPDKKKCTSKKKACLLHDTIHDSNKIQQENKIENDDNQFIDLDLNKKCLNDTDLDDLLYAKMSNTYEEEPYNHNLCKTPNIKHSTQQDVGTEFDPMELSHDIKSYNNCGYISNNTVLRQNL